MTSIYTLKNRIQRIYTWEDRPRKAKNGSLALYVPTDVIYQFNSVHGDWVRPYVFGELTGRRGSRYATIEGDEDEAVLNSKGWDVFKSGAGAISTDGTRVTLDSGADIDLVYLRPTWIRENFVISGYFNVDNYSGLDYGISLYILKNSTDRGFTFSFTRSDTSQYAVFTDNGSSSELTQDRMGGDYDLYQNEQWVELYCDVENEIATAWIGHSVWPTHRIEAFGSQAITEDRFWLGDIASSRSADVILREVSLSYHVDYLSGSTLRWIMEEDDGNAFDSSGNGNSGTFGGTPVYNGGSVTFDGSTDDLISDTTLTLTDFTIIFEGNNFGNEGDGALWDLRVGATDDRYLLYIPVAGGTVGDLTFWDGTTNHGTGLDWSTVNANDLAVTRSGTEVNVYVDGVSYGPFTVANRTITSADFSVMADSAGATFFLSGDVSHVEIIDRVLTKSEVEAEHARRS